MFHQCTTLSLGGYHSSSPPDSVAEGLHRLALPLWQKKAEYLSLCSKGSWRHNRDILSPSWSNVAASAVRHPRRQHHTAAPAELSVGQHSELHWMTSEEEKESPICNETHSRTDRPQLLLPYRVHMNNRFCTSWNTISDSTPLLSWRKSPWGLQSGRAKA